MLGMLVVFYAFFTYVATKRSAFCTPMLPIAITLMTLGYYLIYRFFRSMINHERTADYLNVILIFIVGIFFIRPFEVLEYRSSRNEARNIKMYNVEIYKKLDKILPDDYVIFNCKSLEDVDVMFYTNNNAYQFWPDTLKIDSIISLDYKVAVFPDHKKQFLPDYFCDHEEILVLEKVLQ